MRTLSRACLTNETHNEVENMISHNSLSTLYANSLSNRSDSQ